MDEDRADLGVRPSDARWLVGHQRDLLTCFGIAKAATQGLAALRLPGYDRVAEVVDTAGTDAIEVVGRNGTDAKRVHGGAFRRWSSHCVDVLPTVKREQSCTGSGQIPSRRPPLAGSAAPAPQPSPARVRRARRTPPEVDLRLSRCSVSEAESGE